MLKAQFNYNTNPKTLRNFNQTFIDVKTLGKGHFGETHLVQNNNKLYALKMLSPLQEDVRLINTEVAALTQLSKYPNCNPNLLCYYDYFLFNYQGKKYYGILTEYIEGMNLETYSKKYHLTQENIRVIGVWLLQTIQYLHDLGFVHNDIHARNIMVTNKGKLKLIDFGLACKIRAKTEDLKCRSDNPVYTNHIAPELFTKEFWLNPGKFFITADVFAIGSLLYKLLTNKDPYVRDNFGRIKSKYRDIDSCLNTPIKQMLLINPNLRANSSKGIKLLDACRM